MERILIQPEWDQILNENSKEPVWVQFKTSSDPAINEYIHFFNSDGSPFKLNGEKKQTINIKQISKENRSVELEIESDEYKYRKIIRKFVAPVSKFAPHLDFKTQSKIQPVTCVDVTEGGLGVSCSIDGALLIWLAETGQVRRILDGHIGDVNFCRFFPSGLVVLSGAADLRLKVWSAEDGSSPVTLTGHTYGVSDAAIVERGRNIVSVGRDGQCKLFDVGESKCLATVAKYDCIINACSIITLDDEQIINRLNIPPREEPKSDREVETENKLIACACEDGYLRVLSLNSRKQIFEYDCKSSVNCCCFLDQNSVACGTQNGYIIIVELSDNSHTPWQEFRSSILSIKKFGPNEGFIATTADGSCFTWSLSSTRSTVDLTGPNCDPVYNAAFNSTHVFTSCRDGYIRKYSIENLLNDD